MQGIELKEFQINCVNKLLDATTVGNKKEILVQAPTGSGKTIILLDYIQEYIEENKNTIFVWLTPGKGDLEEQSRTKMTKYLPSMNSKNFNDILHVFLFFTRSKFHKKVILISCKQVILITTAQIGKSLFNIFKITS